MDTLRERYLAKARPKAETITPAFLGEPVDVVTLGLSERRQLLEAAAVDGEQDQARLQALLVIATVRDPATQEKVFSAADLDTLLALPAIHLDEVAATAMILNGLAFAVAQAGAEKN